MSLRYCFEESKVLRTLNASKPHDLAVIVLSPYYRANDFASKSGVMD